MVTSSLTVEEFRLQVIHSAKLKAYVEWKHRELRNLQPSPIHHNQNNGYPFWRFVTRCHPYLTELRQLFYREGRKAIPDVLREIFNHPKALAVWFMDDGTLDRRQGSILFETQCFEIEDLECLKEVLEINFSIKTTIHRSGAGKGRRLYVTVAEARKLANLIEPYVLPELRYKLPFPVTTDGRKA